ncbi:hypothetical protein D3C83_58230 [compost metagenome]
MLKVGVDHARGLRGGRAGTHGPCAHFLGSGGEEGLQAKQPVTGADDAIQAGLGEAKVGEECRPVRFFQFRNL